MIELVEAVLKWWSDHQYDVNGPYGEYNTYDDTPEFVEIAQKMKAEEKS